MDIWHGFDQNGKGTRFDRNGKGRGFDQNGKGKQDELSDCKVNDTADQFDILCRPSAACLDISVQSLESCKELSFPFS